MRKAEFLEFYVWCIDNFPKSLRDICGVRDLFSEYFKGADQCVMKPVCEIKEMIVAIALDAIDDLPEGVVSKELFEKLGGMLI